VHDGFGRLCWKIIDREYYGQVEFFVMWEADEDLFKSSTGGYAKPEDLDVRPYKPRPWIVNPPIEIKHKQWAEEHRKEKELDGDSNVRGSQEMSAL
jgi:hypothetical protein